MFPIRRVDRSQAGPIEQLGTKRKFWFAEGDRRLLFKAEDRGTGEDWAEVVACHLFQLLDIPHVDYELAVECAGQKELSPGAVCENMAPQPVSLILGNELLQHRDPRYPQGQKFKVRQHTIGAVTDVLRQLDAPMPRWITASIKEVRTALDFFVGYVMLDAWIANQDRHHENWAVIQQREKKSLSPSFDHGAAFARNLTDEEREERLKTKDINRSVAAFAAKAKSSFYAVETDVRRLGTLDAFLAFGSESPRAMQEWLRRLAIVEPSEVSDILNQVPQARMSPTTREFTLQLLTVNQRRLLQSGVGA
jgi:hypothetical protein